MFSEKCKLQGRKGIQHLDQVGPYLVITNRCLFETGESSRYALINAAQLQVHSIHDSQDAAVVSARAQNQHAQ